jgi:hypothetical protein
MDNKAKVKAATVAELAEEEAVGAAELAEVFEAATPADTAVSPEAIIHSMKFLNTPLEM